MCSSEPAFAQYSFAELTSISFGAVSVCSQRRSRPSVSPVTGSLRIGYANGNASSG